MAGPIGVSRGEVAKAGALGMLGIALDAYDLVAGVTIGGLVFPRVFFPAAADPVATTVFSLLAVTLITFIFRPLGAMLFGHIGDRLGRKTAMVWNLFLAAVGALAIALAPDYATAGYLGLALVILGRIMHGLAIGGEQGGAVSLVVEQAYARGTRWRHFWASIQWMGFGFATLLASGLLAWLSAVYPGQAFYAFGWRIAFYVGALTAVVGFLVRLILLESLLFQEARRTIGIARAPAIEVFRYWKRILAGVLAYSPGIFAYYLVTSYSVVYATGLGFTRDLVLQSVTLSSILTIFAIPLAAALADMVDRKWVITSGAALAALASIGYNPAVLAKNPTLLFAIQTLMSVAVALNGSPQQYRFAQLFPTRYRYSGVGLTIAITTIVTGGIGPPLLAALIGTAYADRWFIIPLLMAMYSIVSILVIVFAREPEKEKLEH